MGMGKNGYAVTKSEHPLSDGCVSPVDVGWLVGRC